MPLTIEEVERLAGKALAHGATRHSYRTVEWSVSGNCSEPITTVVHSNQTGNLKQVTNKLVAAPSGALVRKRVVKPRPMMQVILHVPCRRCSVCLQKKAYLWRHRAVWEIAQAERTWFGTLTLRPEEHYKVDLLAKTHERETLETDYVSVFDLRAREVGKMATRYFKRLRKETGQPFRYLLVNEIHDGKNTSPEMRGRPHLHVLLHEFTGQPFRKELLQRQWPHGFSNWKLVENVKAAGYITKYISKALDARVRASINYGTFLER